MSMQRCSVKRQPGHQSVISIGFFLPVEGPFPKLRPKGIDTIAVSRAS